MAQAALFEHGLCPVWTLTDRLRRLALSASLSVVRDLKAQFRNGFYAGLGLALISVVYLTWLWQADRQVERHNAKLLHRIEARDWPGVGDLLASDYLDQWGQDRSLVLARLQGVFRYVRGGRIMAQTPIVVAGNGKGLWRAKISVEGEGEVLDLIKQRLNSVSSPFELEWRRTSSKPWDWQLVRVSNPEFEIPNDLD
jgi:hypothetical protein